MIRAGVAIVALASLASCPRFDSGIAATRAPDLETAAMLVGLVRDPSDTSVTGLYARDADRLCVVPQGGGYRIGAHADLGDNAGCDGIGTLTRSGERLHIDLGDGCDFDARFDGDRITFPATLPDACARRCSRRASFAALDAVRLSESAAEASTMRDGRGRLPCAEH